MVLGHKKPQMSSLIFLLIASVTCTGGCGEKGKTGGNASAPFRDSTEPKQLNVEPHAQRAISTLTLKQASFADRGLDWLYPLVSTYGKDAANLAQMGDPTTMYSSEGFATHTWQNKPWPGREGNSYTATATVDQEPGRVKALDVSVTALFGTPPTADSILRALGLNIETAQLFVVEVPSVIRWYIPLDEGTCAYVDGGFSEDVAVIKQKVDHRTAVATTLATKRGNIDATKARGLTLYIGPTVKLIGRTDVNLDCIPLP
jgi:hypothetical protein